jgi:Lipocalin-like domain
MLARAIGHSSWMVNDADQTPLHGAWRLVSYDDRVSSDMPWAATYGSDVDGLIIYDSSGWLSVNVCGAGRFDSYFGLFTVLEAERRDSDVVGVVNHEIVASSIPELLTIDQTRPFRIAGETLILGDEDTWRRICRRLPANAD